MPCHDGHACTGPLLARLWTLPPLLRSPSALLLLRRVERDRASNAAARGPHRPDAPIGQDLPTQGDGEPIVAVRIMSLAVGSAATTAGARAR